jgi:hypothetical protein
MKSASGEVIIMCTSGDGMPVTAGEALGMMDAALNYFNGDFLNGFGGRGLDSAALMAADLGGVLEALGVQSAKFAAARGGSWPGSTQRAGTTPTGTGPRPRGWRPRAAPPARPPRQRCGGCGN